VYIIINVNYSCWDYRHGLGEDSLGKITLTIAGLNYCWMTCNVYITYNHPIKVSEVHCRNPVCAFTNIDNNLDFAYQELTMH